MTELQDCVNSISGSLEEGNIQGAIIALEYLYPNITPLELGEYLRKIFPIKYGYIDVEYWIERYELK